jgi:hypothetical protein
MRSKCIAPGAGGFCYYWTDSAERNVVNAEPTVSTPPAVGPMRRQGSPWLWKLIAVLILAAAAIAFGVWRFHRPQPSSPGSESRAAEEKGQPQKLAVPLRAQTRETRSTPVIHLQWDPSATPVRRSSYGILYIYDGGSPRQLVLHRPALDSGFTDYTPVSDEITFHLVLERGRPGGESILVLLGARKGARIGLESER